MRVGSLTTLRRARPAGWAALLVCASGALILPGLHVVEHLREEAAAVAAARETPRARVRRLLFEALHPTETAAATVAHRHAPGAPLHTHTHAPDGSRQEGGGGAPDPGHGRGALAHLGVLLAPTATFVFLPAAAPLAALDVPPLRTRAVVSTLLEARSPRGPPRPVQSET